ncbi:MAG: carbamoyltransferase C-terminal domain-containing protein, partial [Prevotellaceae bacterium]|nr:carbamoyltransferase C-terminal domain-containing protein [Prevotellaceae bacterium]
YNHLSDARLYEYVATKISEGNIVGWFQGRMEFGPRALGNRSILADARNAHMKDIVNSKVKFREEFRPFAPVVLQEKAHEYFNCPTSPYMMFTTQVSTNANLIPSVTHVDNSARVQTVTRRENERLYNLLIAYEQITGIPILLNTSFNVMGEPIVCNLHDAILTFLS